MVFPGPGVVCKQKTKGLTRQHLAVNGGNLMRQRLDLGGCDGEVWIEQVGEAQPVCLRCEA